MDWHVYRSRDAAMLIFISPCSALPPIVTLFERSAAWDASSITYYLDGRLYHTVNASAALLPTQPMHIIFDQVRAPARCSARYPYTPIPLQLQPLTRVHRQSTLCCSPRTAAPMTRTKAMACPCALRGCARMRRNKNKWGAGVEHRAKARWPFIAARAVPDK